MSWKSFASVTMLCALMAAPALAQPALNVTRTYNQAEGAIIWEVTVDHETDGSLAVELPFTLEAASSGFTAQVFNEADQTNGGVKDTWYYNTATGSGDLLWNTQQNAAEEEQNPGNNPFTGAVTEGLYVNGLNIFAALGSDVDLPDPVPTLHIASTDGVLSWENAIIAEGGTNNTGISGMLSSVVVGDMNGNGTVNFGDLAAFGLGLTNPPDYEAQFPGLDRVARGDANDNDQFNFGDLAAFGALLTGGGAGASVAAVPEPGTMALVFLALCGIAGLARRK